MRPVPRGARRRGFRRAVRLTSLWCVVFSAGVSLLAFLGGGAFIDFVSTSPPVRAAARAYLPFAALTPLCGAMAFEFDGVFIGATWTRDMRNLMLAALALYLALFFALRPFGNAGLWMALLGFLARARRAAGLALSALAAQPFPPALPSMEHRPQFRVKVTATTVRQRRPSQETPLALSVTLRGPPGRHHGRRSRHRARGREPDRGRGRQRLPRDRDSAAIASAVKRIGPQASGYRGRHRVLGPGAGRRRGERESPRWHRRPRHSAGITGPNITTWDYPAEDWRKVIDVNLNGLFYCNKALVPAMREGGYGRIVNIASVAGKEGNPNAPAYSASKAGVIGLTKSLGKELAERRDGELRDACGRPDRHLRPDDPGAHRLHAVEDPDGALRRCRGDRVARLLVGEPGMLLFDRRRLRRHGRTLDVSGPPSPGLLSPSRAGASPSSTGIPDEPYGC